MALCPNGLSLAAISTDGGFRQTLLHHSELGKSDGRGCWLGHSFTRCPPSSPPSRLAWPAVLFLRTTLSFLPLLAPKSIKLLLLICNLEIRVNSPNRLCSVPDHGTSKGYTWAGALLPAKCDWPLSTLSILERIGRAGCSYRC